jgi:CheY-like chemotaxis protein
VDGEVMAKILIVDDDPSVRYLTKRLLQREGHDVFEAQSGEECREKLKSVTPDLILLDVMMPNEDGWDLCRWIKRNEKTKDTPVVMFTVKAQEEDKKKSLEYGGADDHISKPFRIIKFLNQISGLLKE